MNNPAQTKTKIMKQTDLFFSQVIDLQHHALPPHIMNAFHAVYVEDYDFERLKRDLQGAIREEAGVLG